MDKVTAEHYNRIITKLVFEIDELREHMETVDQRESDAHGYLIDSKRRAEGYLQEINDLNAELAIQKEAVRGLQGALGLMGETFNNKCERCGAEGTD